MSYLWRFSVSSVHMVLNFFFNIGSVNLCQRQKYTFCRGVTVNTHQSESENSKTAEEQSEYSPGEGRGQGRGPRRDYTASACRGDIAIQLDLLTQMSMRHHHPLISSVMRYEQCEQWPAQCCSRRSTRMANSRTIRLPPHTLHHTVHSSLESPHSYTAVTWLTLSNFFSILTRIARR